MQAIPRLDRQRLGALLDQQSQESVMKQIPQFAQAQIYDLVHAPEHFPGSLGALVFNMERGVHLEELGDFLLTCPDIRPFDVILANELDDGCARSGNRDTARELAQRLGMNYVYALEFIELANPEDAKGYHGNAIFSRWPIRRATVVRLPEQYNWYFDRQRRIGGRCAVLAEIQVAGRSVGIGSIHLENRTHGPGRQAQLEAVLQAAEAMFPGLPIILGGDLNTNTFDGRDRDAICQIAASPELQRRCLEDVAAWEGALPVAEAMGYTLVPIQPAPTRRKPLPWGGALALRLDWLLVRGMTATDSRTISTRRANCGFAPAGSALARFTGEELSDHNAVWALCGWQTT